MMDTGKSGRGFLSACMGPVPGIRLWSTGRAGAGDEARELRKTSPVREQRIKLRIE